MKTRFRWISLYTLGFLVVGVSNSFAASAGSAFPTGLSIGGLVGADFTSAGSYNSSNISYGGTVGYHLDPTWEVGVFYTSTSTTPSTLPILGYSSTLGLLLGAFNYHFAAELSPLYIGVLAGIGFESITLNNLIVPAPTASNTLFSFGGQAGYDYMLGASGLSVGPRVAFVYVTAPTGGNSTSDFQAQGAVKYWF